MNYRLQETETTPLAAAADVSVAENVTTANDVTSADVASVQKPPPDGGDERLAYLLGLSGNLLKLTDADAILSKVVEGVNHLFQPDMAMVFFFNKAKTALVPVMGVGWPNALTSDAISAEMVSTIMADGHVAHVLERQTSIIVEDFLQSDMELPPIMRALGVRSGIGVPLIINQEAVGVIGLQWKSPQQFEPTDLDYLLFVANMLGSALERARLIREAEATQAEADSRAWEMESRAQLSVSLRRAHTPSQLADTFVKHLGRTLTAVWAMIFHQDRTGDDESDDLRLAATYHASGVAQTDFLKEQPSIQIDPASLFLQEVFAQENCLLLPGHVPEHAHLLTGKEQALFGHALDRTLFLGIRDRQGDIFGLIVLSWPQRSPIPASGLTAAQQRLLLGVGEMAANALRRASTMGSLEQRVAEHTAELQEANQRLQELDRLKSKFIADISHELRTPVTNLSFYLNLLEHGRLDKRADYLRVLRTETANLTQLIEDTLDLSRLEQRLADLHLSPVYVPSLLQELGDSFEEAFATKDIRLDLTWEDDVGDVIADHNRLHQALAAVITNSLQFTDQGHVTVRCYLDGERLCVEVADTGIGVPADELDQVFGRFFRASNATLAGMVGPGLGLSIVKQIVELHKGDIGLQSQEGAGTTVRICLPRHTGAQADPA